MGQQIRRAAARIRLHRTAHRRRLEAPRFDAGERLPDALHEVDEARRRRIGGGQRGAHGAAFFMSENHDQLRVAALDRIFNAGELERRGDIARDADDEELIERTIEYQLRRNAAVGTGENRHRRVLVRGRFAAQIGQMVKGDFPAGKSPISLQQRVPERFSALGRRGESQQQKNGDPTNRMAHARSIYRHGSRELRGTARDAGDASFTDKVRPAVQPPNVTLAVPVSLLVLIGGGEFSFGETREIDEFLVRSLPAGRRTIAFLPTASGSAEYATHLGSYFRQIDPELQVINVPIYRGRDSRRQKNLHHLLEAGMIYLGGGVTNALLSTLRESPADIAMRNAAANGTIVAAIGAAASSFGVYARDMRTGGSALPALGWLAGTVIESGFDAQNDVMLRRLMSLPEVTVGIGIPPRNALAIHAGGATTLLGSGGIAVFRKS